jgi:hypothetical protein
LVTQVFGNQFNYEGSSVLYKYDMPLIWKRLRMWFTVPLYIEATI